MHEQLPAKVRKELALWVNDAYLQDKKIVALRKSFLSASPFSHLALCDLLLEKKFAQLERAVRRLPMDRKEADLFSFLQSGDLLACKDPTIRSFLSFWESDAFRTYLFLITGIKTKSIDSAAFCYEAGDYLLCHDDRLSGRKIAYVLQFDTRKQSDGGALALLGADRFGRPTAALKRLIPTRNTLTLFKVTKTSHHQVEEVLSGTRLTVTGWFHA